MARKKETPGVEVYYETIQKAFQLQAEYLTAVLPHLGERGTNDEARIRDFLTKVLPERFSVGTGFVVCSERDVPPSNQMDIVISDCFWNAPLHREFLANVYPVEAVYATVEVKSVLTKKRLTDALAAISGVRRLAQHKRLSLHRTVARNPDRPDSFVDIPSIVNGKAFGHDLPPRAFILAYSCKGWKTVGDLVDWLEVTAENDGSWHVHGLAVLDRDWFVTQVPHKQPNEPLFRTIEQDALLYFAISIVNLISAFPMIPTSLEAYMSRLPSSE